MEVSLQKKDVMILEKNSIEAKKRKMDALISFVSDDILPSKVKKSTSYDDIVGSEDHCKKTTSSSGENAFPMAMIETIQLTSVGRNAQVILTPSWNIDLPKKKLDPLFVEDIYNFLMKFLYGNLSNSSLRWCEISKHVQVKKLVFLVIQEPSKSSIIQSISLLENVVTIFPCAVDVLTSISPFALELAAVHLTSKYQMKFSENCSTNHFSSLFPMVNKPSPKSDFGENFSKLQLLLSPVQLVMENYPLPNSVFENSKSNDYCFTKNIYSHVTADSPMFAVDCEMCRTTTGKLEVTRVAIVNENLKTVYSTLVKPDNKIVDFLTKFSGITEDMLMNVKTNLSDVQKQIQNILPSDAILCGQSLNCDLHALQMFHPYVIDTSVIFNSSGIRNKKDSLKNLVNQFLGETIQDCSSGHSPIEDSIATMKLVQLKLKRNLIFGDLSLGSHFSRIKNAQIFNTESGCSEDLECQFQYANYVDVMKISNYDTESLDSHLVDPHFKCQCSSKISQDIENSLSNDVTKCDFTCDTFINAAKDSFFTKLQQSGKKICLIGDKKSVEQHYSQVSATNVVKISKTDSNAIFDATICNIDSHDFIMSNVIFDENDASSFSDLDTNVKQLYDSIPNKTLFMCFTTGAHNEEINHGLFMLVLKNSDNL